MILASTTADGSGNVEVDNFSTIVSHELVERSVNDVQIFHVPSGEAAASNGVYTTTENVQACDGEQESYLYRLNGTVMQSYWSDVDGAAIVPNVDYTTSLVNFELSPNWSDA